MRYLCPKCGWAGGRPNIEQKINSIFSALCPKCDHVIRELSLKELGEIVGTFQRDAQRDAQRDVRQFRNITSGRLLAALIPLHSLAWHQDHPADAASLAVSMADALASELGMEATHG
jgi:hypothetical protein